MRKSVVATQNTKHTYHMLLKTDQLINQLALTGRPLDRWIQS